MAISKWPISTTNTHHPEKKRIMVFTKILNSTTVENNKKCFLSTKSAY